MTAPIIRPLRLAVEQAVYGAASEPEHDSGRCSRRLAPRTLRELMNNPALLAPPPAIVPGLAYAGRTVLLAGREKSGKSTISTQGAAVLSLGGEFLGSELERGRVLFYQLDEDAGDTVRRLAALGADWDAISVQVERPTPEEMTAEIAATGATWVIVDCLSELWRGLVRSSRDEDEVSRALRPYMAVPRETGAALTLLAHANKRTGDYRGSTEIGAAVDVVLTLRQPGLNAEPEADEWETAREDDGRRLLTGKGRGGISLNHRLAFDGQRYSLGTAPLPLAERITRELAVAPASANAIADMLGVRRADVLDALRRLCESGQAVAHGAANSPRRTYELVAP